MSPELTEAYYDGISKSLTLLKSYLFRNGIVTMNLYPKNIVCMKCLEKSGRRCYITKDRLDEYIDKMLKAERILLALPTYFGSDTAEMRMLIDRAGS